MGARSQLCADRADSGGVRDASHWRSRVGSTTTQWYAQFMAKKKRETSALEDDPFGEGLLDWMNSPAGQESEEVREVVWPLLERADVDAKRRKILWEDGQRLTVEQSAKRIKAAHPDLAFDVIRDKVISWLELGFSPEDRSQEELDELDRLLDEWLEEFGC
jgi:hypothetical protein